MKSTARFQFAATAAIAALALSGCVAGENADGSVGEAAAATGGELTVDFATCNPLSLIIKDQGWLEAELEDEGVTVKWVQSAGSNKANAVTWEMGGDLEETVSSLRSKGVTFEQYDIPGMTWRDGIHEAGDTKLAWFKDPDGNILHLVEGM